MELNVQLGGGSLTLGGLNNLKVGDIIPITISDTVQAEVDGVPVFEGHHGTKNGRYAIKVERFVEFGPFTSVKIGDRVAVNPSRPCWACKFCHEGLPNQCLDMRFYGSAMRDPHVEGAFRNLLLCDAVQCEKVAPGFT